MGNSCGDGLVGRLIMDSLPVINYSPCRVAGFGHVINSVESAVCVGGKRLLEVLPVVHEGGCGIDAHDRAAVIDRAFPQVRMGDARSTSQLPNFTPESPKTITVTESDAHAYTPIGI